ncbi:MAG: nitrite reductase small subunit NirD [Methylococcales bacterium]|jgi:nitrite reductase (NADH) small subunit|nr:nitrite reductase small subunit NirD [Methylococcales bacterium]MBT7445900.1 nitrite reductase small subunit NirD [Methylococcales bacterium]
MSKWIEIAPLSDIPVLGSRVVKTDSFSIAVFRGTDDSVFAIKDACPHKDGPLSQGIMHGTTVTCPLHNWKINLANGEALGADEGCTNVFETKVENAIVYLKNPQ